MPLTEASARDAKPKEKSYRLFDSGGLYLEVTPNGSKLWRLKYRFGGKEKRLALGAYPDVSLGRARRRRQEARRLLAEGVDPSEYRRTERAAQRVHQEHLIASKSFVLNSAGALSLRLDNRRLILTPTETAALRTFLRADP